MAPGESTATDTVRLVLVPHTHWDREWYLPFEGFLERLVEMMDTLIALLSSPRGSSLHFHLDGQTALIDDYLAVRPEREEDIRRLAAAGRISVGPWFTQMDEFLVSGESHLRNLERGLARARDLVGDPTLTPPGYLPDQFGHVSQMPQILLNGGLDRAVVWRGVPREVDRTSFWWEAPDGSRVLTEYLMFGYSLGAAIRSKVEPADLAAALGRAAERMAPVATRDRFLVTVGSDHHGPDPTLVSRLDVARQVDARLEPTVGSLVEYLDGPPPEDLPVVRGELRSSARAHLLPGVYSTRPHQKGERGAVETLVERVAEPLAALVPGFAWPAEDFDRIWQRLLWNGAHDSACGCSVDQVAHDVDGRHAEARRLAESIVDAAMECLAERLGDAGTVTFNPSPFERDGVPPLGWALDARGAGAGSTPEHPEIAGDHLVHAGIRFRVTDEPDVGDLYNFCPADGAVPRPPDHVRSVGATELAMEFGDDLRLAIDAHRWLDGIVLGVQVDNARTDHRLRLHVQLPGSADGSVAGSPFDLVRRPLQTEGSDLEAAVRTWPAQHVVIAGDMTVLRPGVFEYEVTEEGTLAVTLMRCVGTISRRQLATRPFAAGPDVATPEAQMPGRTEFRIGILPLSDPVEALRAWERFALPLPTAEATGGGDLQAIGSLLDLDAGGAALSNVRRRDGRIEARLWNPTDGDVVATVGGRVELAPRAIVTVDVTDGER